MSKNLNTSIYSNFSNPTIKNMYQNNGLMTENISRNYLTREQVLTSIHEEDNIKNNGNYEFVFPTSYSSFSRLDKFIALREFTFIPQTFKTGKLKISTRVVECQVDVSNAPSSFRDGNNIVYDTQTRRAVISHPHDANYTSVGNETLLPVFAIKKTDGILYHRNYSGITSTDGTYTKISLNGTQLTNGSTYYVSQYDSDNKYWFIDIIPDDNLIINIPTYNGERDYFDKCLQIVKTEIINKVNNHFEEKYEIIVDYDKNNNFYIECIPHVHYITDINKPAFATKLIFTLTGDALNDGFNSLFNQITEQPLTFKKMVNETKNNYSYNERGINSGYYDTNVTARVTTANYDYFNYLDNVFNFHTLFIHSTFCSNSEYNYLATMGEHNESLTKLYMELPGENKTTFKTWFTTDGQNNKIIIRNVDFKLELCYIMNAYNNLSI